MYLINFKRNTATKEDYEYDTCNNNTVENNNQKLNFFSQIQYFKLVRQ